VRVLRRKGESAPAVGQLAGRRRRECADDQGFVRRGCRAGESGDAEERDNARMGEYTRNIADDYRKAFGEEPPPIAGFAIMTDTDDTGDSVTSWYGDIALARAAR
jgi:hypothetical protein